MRKLYKINSIILAIITCLIVTYQTTQTHAHEIFSSYPLRWVVKSPSGSYYHIKISGYLLSSNSIYRDNINGAATAWTGSPTLAYCTLESFSTSNLDLATPTNDFWDRYNLGSGVLALAVPSDTNSRQIFTENDAKNSTRQISYGAVFFNPNHTPGYSWIFDGIDDHDDQQLGVIIHEIGHMYGLGHCDQKTESIMRPIITSSNPLSLVKHDIDDMKAFYK